MRYSRMCAHIDLSHAAFVADAKKKKTPTGLYQYVRLCCVLVVDADSGGSKLSSKIGRMTSTSLVAGYGSLG